MVRSRWAIGIVGILATVLILSAVSSLLPDYSYLRFQLLTHTQQGNTQWFYERIHFDSRPIDVAIVGPSTTQLGLSSTLMKERLAERGLSAEIVNFAVTFGGRDLTYATVKEMYEGGRRPKLLIIGVTERPSHFGHPAFKYVADAGDVIGSLYLINLRYLSNLQYLPFRQTKLAAMALAPKAFGVRFEFDPVSYDNYRDFDPAVLDRFFDGSPIGRERRLSRAELLRDASNVERGGAKAALPAALEDLEFGDEKFYIPKIMALAQDHGTKVAFVYIPRFQGPPQSLQDAVYAHYGPVYNASFVADSDQLFFEVEHLNREGAREVTDWLTDRIAHMLAD
jgi:hypothetical protein